MALRSRSHPPSRSAAATSGPGRAPASDGRARHRRPTTAGTARGPGPGLRPGGRETRRGHRLRGGRDRDASAEELVRRAEALFGEGTGPGTRGVGGVGRTRRVPTWAVGGEDESVARSGRGPAAARGDVDGGEAGTWEEVPEPAASDPVSPGERRPVGRTVLALRERLPLWVRTRCGLERRSVVALSVLLVLAVGFAAQHFWAGRTQPVRAPEVVGAAVPRAGDGAGSTPVTSAGAVGEAPGTSAGSGTAMAGTALPEIVVDVGGKVRDPGVHRLPAGSRVADALRAAGGVRPGTRTDGLNRARFLVDGEQVIVGGPPPTGAGAGQAPAAGGPAGVAPGAGPATPVSLNTATLDQLDGLPGVGPVLARHILDYRTRNGGFRSVDELREVNGIGDRRFADLKNLVRP
ncbi:ComEA family DNA-binding protein [Streptomyces sp. KMM 9044]|uniref:ComEA family DNA-binding protein n=1 Tax=Streptomyces sp. KMM 9044 TaxID=2744474 RepID=UPI0021515F4B|nr:ComEA family DNA-binding protein [Streptomyces sp. KMM 9044]WAX80112.1 ComEA family DNA-binding protein [Streptomyces sp. KMM 9044]